MVSGLAATSNNMILESLGKQMLDLIKDRRTESMVYGMVAKSRKQGAVRSGSGNGRFDKGLNNEDDGFWKNCQIEHMDLEGQGQELVDWKKD